MPIENDELDAIAAAYVERMTSIRSRRVHRLVMRVFSRFDQVVRAVAEDGGSVLLAVAETGAAAVCRTDGRGPAASVMAWPRLQGATVATAYDLTKDSLPIVGWTLWHPSFVRIGGALTVAAADLPAADQARLTEALARLGS